MLHHDHGVAELAQAPQRVEQPRIVALVQADRRLVEHIEHAGEAGADLRRQPDALALAARQRARGARQREIVEADVAEEGQAVADLLQDALRDLVALGVEFLRQFARPGDRRLDRKRRDLADMLAVDLHRERLRLQAIAVAGLAGRRGHVTLDFLARPLALGFLVAPLEILDHALEGFAHLISAQPVVIGETHLLVAGAVEDHGARLLGQFAPGLVEPEFVVLAERLQGLEIIGRARFRPRGDGALAQAQARVGNDERGVDRQVAPEAAAGGAGAKRVVEREQPRLDLRDRETRDRAGEFGREENGRMASSEWRMGGRAIRHFAIRYSPLLRDLDDREPIRQLQRRLETLGEAARHVGPDDEPIDHDFDVVLELLVERGRVGDLVEFAVDLHPLKAALHEIGDFLAIFAFAAADDRRQQIEPRALGQGQHAVDHLADGLAFDRQAGGGRIGNADARPEQAHVIVDFRHRADGRARVLRRRLLLDRDRRREPVDLVDVGLLHHFQELARIGRKQLDIAALALGVDRVEGERGLAGAGEAGENDELVARDRQIDVLQIVLARAAHHDGAPAEQLFDRRRRVGSSGGFDARHGGLY